MAPPIALAAALEPLRRLADHAGGGITRERIERLADLAASADPDQRELSLGEVADALFPAAADPVGRFRAFRSALRQLAADGDVDLYCEVDGHKHAPAHARRCWFAGADDRVRRIERLSRAATSTPGGSTAIEARARRAVRVCVDARWTRLANDLSHRLSQSLALDRDLEIEVSDTQPLAGQSKHAARRERLAWADLVVCLIDQAYLAKHGLDELRHAVVVPVAIEAIGADPNLRGFETPFHLDGIPYASCRRRPLFVSALRDHIALRLTRSASAADLDWDRLVPDDEGPIIDARALRTQLDRRPPSRVALDATVDVQDYMRSWADSPVDRPYLVIFGEYGMGKTTATHVFTRRLLERRRIGDETARLPIYLDLRRLGDVKHREPTLEAILDDLLRRVWQAGGTHAAPTAGEVIEHVQRRRAVVVFDGLDEVLVHLREPQGQSLLRELWKILPPAILADPQGRDRAGRVVLTCRTHFFRTLRDQHAYFRGEEREVVGPDSYAAMHLLPFSPDQVRAYFERRGPDRGPGTADRAVELIRSVHDLSDLARRPFNLRLVADRLESLEHRIAAGEHVDSATLYEDLVATWLDRDQGKHQLPPRHKISLMCGLAAELWREGRRSLPVDRLETWLERRIDGDNELGRWFRLERADLSMLAEDLRTATFIVRPGADEFEFAHTSLLEYFLARHLARALADDDSDAWALPTLSPETIDFLAAIISAGDVEAYQRGLRALRTPYRPRVSELAFTYCVRAIQRGAPAIALAGFDLSGAKLRGLAITGPADGPMVRLSDCSFAGADLREIRLRRVRVESCDLAGAQLARAELRDSTLDRVNLTGADMTGTTVASCHIVGVDLRPAHAHRTQWLGCSCDGVSWPASGEAHLFAGPPLGLEPTRRPEREGASLEVFVGHTGGVNCVAWSPDATRLASAGSDRGVRIWDPATAEPLRHLTGHTASVQSVAWSPDAARVASAGRDGGVWIWDPEAGDPVQHVAGHAGWVNSVAWSPDATRLASAGNDGAVRIWDPESGTRLRDLAGHDGGASSVAWSSDGTRLGSAGNDGAVRIWDPETGTQLRQLAGHFGGVRSLAWSPDAVLLASADADGGLRIWYTQTGDYLLHVSGQAGGVHALAWSPDGAWLASAGSDGAVRIWDAATGDYRRQLARHAVSVLSVGWSPDATRLASASDDGAIHIWDPATGEHLHQLPGHTVSVQSVAWSPDVARLASASEDGIVRTWDPATGEHLHDLTGHTGRVLGIAWSPAAARLASAGNDGMVRIWDPATGEELQHLTGNADRVNSVAWSPDGARLASSGTDGVRIWDPANGEQLQHLAGDGGWVNGVAWSPDASRLASAGDDGAVRIWNPETAEQLQHRAIYAGPAYSVAWSPDGTRLASVASDRGVRIWDAATAEELQHLIGHTASVQSVAWSPDASRLASAGNDGAVRIWNPATAEQLRHLAGHAGANSVAWSPDAARLATAGSDGAVRIWDPETGNQLVAVHLFAGNEHAALIDGRIASCSAGAWRWLGWIAPSAVTGRPTRYPAEVFGPVETLRPAAIR